MTSEPEQISDRAILANLREPLFVVDSAGTIVFTTERLERVTTGSEGTLESKSLTQIEEYITDGFESLTRGIEDILEDDTEECRVELETSHPKTAPVAQSLSAEARISRFTDNEELVGALVVLRDITTRKQTEGRFRKMFEFHSAPMLLIAPDSGDIIEANAAAADFYGYTTEELTDMTHQQINSLPPAEVARERERARREDRNQFIFKHQLASGEMRTVEVHSSPLELDGEIFLFSIIHDITERVESRHESQLFKEAVSQTGHAILITDKEGIVEYVNPAFEADTGYESEEAVGETPAILKSGKQDEAFYEELWDTILSNEVWEAELVNRRKSGELFYAEQTIAPITDDDGEITNFVAVQLDITDRKLREKQLSDLHRILRHNLRNSLTVITGYARSLFEEVHPEHRGKLERILTQAETLAETSEKITRMRQSIGREYEDDKACDLRTVLSELDAEICETYPEASVEIDPEPVAVNLDPETCQILLTEVIENAIIHNDQETPRVAVTVDAPDESSQHVAVQIKDNGPGIPQQEQKAVSVESDGPLTHSTGVGLAYVHWHIINSGGEVTITDNDPRGSIITLSLTPASEQSRL